MGGGRSALARGGIYTSIDSEAPRQWREVRVAHRAGHSLSLFLMSEVPLYYFSTSRKSWYYLHAIRNPGTLKQWWEVRVAHRAGHARDFTAHPRTRRQTRH